MTASEADALKPGDVVYATFGGWPQECLVMYVTRRPRGSTRRIHVQYTTRDGTACTGAITHRNAWQENADA